MTLAPVLGEQVKVAPTTGGLEYDYRLPPLHTWDSSTEPVAVMPIENIRVDRQAGEPDDIEGLTESIRKHGIIEPLIVTRDGQLVAGRRRLAAAIRAGLATVPVRVRDTVDERAAIMVGLVANVERKDPNPMTLAHSYRALVELDTSVEEVARMVGQDVGHVYQHLALLDLHSSVQTALCAGRLSFASARWLMSLDQEEQARVLNEIVESPKPLSSRQVKAKVDARRVMSLVRKTKGAVPEGEAAPTGDYYALLASINGAKDASLDISASSPIDQLNAIIAEMLTVADGEDEIRRWARRLSRILEALRKMHPVTSRESKEKNVEQVQLI